MAFEPPGATYTPQVSAAQAYASWLAVAGTGPSSNPVVQLADYTDYGWGTWQSDGNFQPTFVGQPVWVFTFTNVPFGSSGPALPPGQKRTWPTTFVEDEVAIVNADTGSAIFTMNSMPDPTPQPPRGPGAPGGA
jgi:hypothetical protein